MGRTKDISEFNYLIGKQFNQLTILEMGPSDKHYNRSVKVQCTCGTVKYTKFKPLISGWTKSCGCFARRHSLVCKNGHVRKRPGMRCHVCLKSSTDGWRTRYKAKDKEHLKNSLWTQNGIINKDGSPFRKANFDEAFKLQNGRCAGCGIHQSELNKALCADHDHSTGFFRGLLCDPCNRTLGTCHENVEALHNLAEYLKRSKVEATLK